MSKTRLLYNSDTWDAGTVWASAETGDLVLSNVQDDQIGKVWQAPLYSGGWLSPTATWDLGAPTAITCLGIFNHNLTASATIRLQANATNSWTSPSYSVYMTDTQAISADADSVALPRYVFFLNQTYRWWRLTFSDTGNPDQYLQIGRIKAGAYYELTRNMNDGFSMQHVDPSEGRPAGGQFTPFRVRNRYRRCSLDFDLVDNTQRRKIEAVFSRVGNHKPLVVCVDPDTYPSEQSMYCRLTTPLSTVYDVVNVYSQGTLVFEEITE